MGTNNMENSKEQLELLELYNHILKCREKIMESEINYLHKTVRKLATLLIISLLLFPLWFILTALSCV